MAEKLATLSFSDGTPPIDLPMFEGTPGTPDVVDVRALYGACATANRQHGAPLAFPSCSPPQPASAQLTVGTPDANGQGANSTGSVLFVAGNGDVRISASITDVRNKGDLSDYTGELQVTPHLCQQFVAEMVAQPVQRAAGRLLGDK